MSGTPTKKGNWGTWAVIDNPPPRAGTRCGGCIHYNEDGSCSVLPILIREVGRDFWKKCKKYTKTRKTNNSVSKQVSVEKHSEASYEPICKHEDTDGRCTLWNSGLSRCDPERCVYKNKDKQKKRTCLSCDFAAVGQSSILSCKKGRKSIPDQEAMHCCYYHQRQGKVLVNDQATPETPTLFSTSEKSALRKVQNKGLFSNKKVLLTGKYSVFSREEAMSLLECLGVKMCLEPEDADIVVQAKTSKMTYKLKAAKKLMSQGKSFRFLSEEEFIAEFKRLLHPSNQ